MTMTMIFHCLSLGLVVIVPRPQCRFGSAAANFVRYNRSRLTPLLPLFVILCFQTRTYLLVASDSRHWYVVGFVFFMPRFDLSCYAMLSQIMLMFVLFNFCSTCTGCLFLSPLVNRFTGIGVFFIFIYCFYLLLLHYGR